MTTLIYLAALAYFHLPVSQAYQGSNTSILCSADNRQIVDNTTDYWPYQLYKSTNATPPYMGITTSGEPLAEGVIFLGQNYRPGTHAIKQQGAMIMTDTSDLVWSGPSSSDVTVSDFKQMTLNGEQVILYWSSVGDQPTEGIGYGQVHILDSTYREIYTICPDLGLTLLPGASSPCSADLHEHYITESNTLLVTAFNLTQADLTSIGGTTDEWVLDALAAEVDLETGAILFTWSALEHVAVNNTQQSMPSSGTSQSVPLDLYHMNSIQSYGEYYLINCRHTFSTYMVDRAGEIMWSLQGQTGGDFGSLPTNGTFSWQHHTRMINESSTTALYSCFDNGNSNPSKNVTSYGVSLRLTLPPNPSNPPELVTSLWDVNEQVYSWAEGSLSQLDNGNYFMGYGIRPIMKEYGPNPTVEGNVRWTAQFADLNSGHSYRAFKTNWHATPYTQPTLIVSQSAVPDSLSNCTGSSSSSFLIGYVSWNGATDVTSYVVYGGASEANLEEIGTFPKQGFETVFAIPSNVKAVQIGAIENNGTSVVQRSAVVTI
ncbi:ASST-domain-containing protein [Talaromyces proteolyticus]|uniref:ASST-domain-containing protein n=1 Tax=Talaromyces proteolyticus TaxID=1131652 RepID=A0AAD4KLE2_9EURO|nr:ASST-domain-containing protein [Talaromyces proteolyticus]KAH8694048.1 ASST-domain-containing protein [Talaromyces proteolyticus]